MLKITEAVELIQQKLLGWTKDFVQMLPNLAVAAVIVVIGWLLARLARLVVRKVLGRWSIGPTLLRLVGNSIYLVVLLVGVFTALSVVHLDKTVTSILAGAGIIGLALGFAFQDLAANFVSGIFMAVQRPLRVGDLVETGGHFGVVQRIDLRTTEITNMQGLQVIIPNKEVFQGVLVNYTHNRTRRVDLEVGISYGEDLAHVKQVTLDAVKGLDGLIPSQPLELFYTAFGDSSIDFELRFWVRAKDQSDFQAHQSAAIMAIKAAYNKEGITIPFPIRTLDFGIKGGEKLDAMWGKRDGS